MAIWRGHQILTRLLICVHCTTLYEVKSGYPFFVFRLARSNLAVARIAAGFRSVNLVMRIEMLPSPRVVASKRGIALLKLDSHETITSRVAQRHIPYSTLPYFTYRCAYLIKNPRTRGGGGATDLRCVDEQHLPRCCGRYYQSFARRFP